MTLQWTAIAVVLYAEVGFIILMMLPWIRPPTWSKIFKSRIVRSIEAYSHIYVYAFGGILVLLFLDAVREVSKYSEVDKLPELQHHTAPADVLIHMRLFRAQRNLYISGFAAFLAVVIRRMMSLILNEARLMASVDASLKQAQSASAAAKQLMEKDPKKQKETAASEEESKETLIELRRQLQAVEAERDGMREQADEVKKEYDNLMDECSRLQKVLTRTGDIDKDE